MIYSTFDKDSNTYFYRKSNKAPQVYLSPAYMNDNFVAWEDVYVELPAGSTADGRGEEAKGILTHPKEIEKSQPETEVKILGQQVEVAGLLFFLGRLAWKALFGDKKD